MKIGDIIFVKNKGWIFDRVRSVIDSDFDHIAVCVSGTHLVEATPTRGVAKEKISKYDSVTHSVCRLKHGYKGHIKSLVSYCESKVGKRYDVLQLISLYILILLGIKRTIAPIDIREAFVCSELIGQGAYSAGIELIEGVEVDRLTPGDIYESDKLEKVI